MKKITLLVLLLIASNYSYSQSSQSVLFMEKENGVYTLPCKVNGIPMKFIFDTGASNVSISLTEAQFLAKQGLLKDNEILDSVKYQIANGEVKEGTRIILRQIEIDGHVLNNVEAFITHEINSPLLLGQSAISKLGKIEIEGNKLVITPKNPRNRFEFLNVDLSKHINDFGYSVIDLKEPLTPYPLEKFTEEEHFLSKYNFDKEVVTFSQSGFIPIIILQKTFNEEKYPGDNLEKAKAFYTKIKEVIVREYGTPSTANARVVEWNSPDYQMMLSLGNDNSVYLSYNNLNIQKFEGSGEKILESQIFTDPQEEVSEANEPIYGQVGDDFIMHLKEGEKKLKNGDHYGAIHSYTKAIALNSNYALPYYNRGTIKQSLGDDAGAIQDYNMAIEIEPDHAEAYANRAIIKSNLEDLEGAIKDLDKALILNPKYPEAYFNRGLAKLKLGMKTLGCLDFKKAGKLGFTKAYETITELCN